MQIAKVIDSEDERNKEQLEESFQPVTLRFFQKFEQVYIRSEKSSKKEKGVEIWKPIEFPTFQHRTNNNNDNNLYLNLKRVYCPSKSTHLTGYEKQIVVTLSRQLTEKYGRNFKEKICAACCNLQSNSTMKKLSLHCHDN